MLPAQIECQSILVFNLKSATRRRRRRRRQHQRRHRHR